MTSAALALPAVLEVQRNAHVVIAGNDKAGAAFSPCDSYRWLLWRMWDPDRPFWTFGMLNPSTATHEKLDPTISRCISRAQAGGAGGLIVWNLFAWRATKPEHMKAAGNPVGPANDRAIKHAIKAGALNIAAWGADGGHKGRDREVLAMLGREGLAMQLHALAFTAAGQPRHPLYLPLDLQPQPWAFDDAGKAI
jgi:hypothetical protein